MGTTSDNGRRHIAVFGAAGRVGRAVAAALLRDGHEVSGVVREPGRCRDLPADLSVFAGDARYPAESAALLRGVDAVVLAVTPFTAPPDSFDGFDIDYYAHIVAGIERHWDRERRRLVAVGLAATLELDSGGHLCDDADLFPPRLRPFAEAHLRQLTALRALTTLDWAVLTPPAGLGAGADTAGEYRLLTGPVSVRQATTELTHARYARAVADQIGEPTVHSARAAVVPAAHR
ncbi:NAD(P)-dependent oxidoreductase [Nocardia testacea]|uniref:NAD(P)-dependent oxidoreductase n=1 Tax=Nocardia testacea TaxID=248551 RepID=UPI0002D54DF6|nr:NAD(P)H-binding protein [Nocardia testacea]